MRSVPFRRRSLVAVCVGMIGTSIRGRSVATARPGTVCASKSVAKEIGWTPFPELKVSVHGGRPIWPSAGEISFQSVNVATVGIHERERSESSGGFSGPPGSRSGTLRVFPERPGTSISVQICWPDEVRCPPTSTEVLSRLTSWLDNWLDQGSFQGLSIIQFRGADGEEFKLLLAEE